MVVDRQPVKHLRYVLLTMEKNLKAQSGKPHIPLGDQRVVRPPRAGKM